MASIFRTPQNENPTRNGGELQEKTSGTPPSTERRSPRPKLFLFAGSIAGRQYYDADDAWPFLHVGMKLRMKWEPENEHDENAVCLLAEADGVEYKLGYLQRQDNEFIANMVKMGWGDAFECVVSRLDPSETYAKQIGITVKVVEAPE